MSGAFLSIFVAPAAEHFHGIFIIGVFRVAPELQGSLFSVSEEEGIFLRILKGDPGHFHSLGEKPEA